MVLAAYGSEAIKWSPEILLSPTAAHFEWRRDETNDREPPQISPWFTEEATAAT
jgi:hypothetical protein